MTNAELKALCTVLGFAAVIFQGEKIPASGSAQRALAIADLIEDFCRAAVPEAFDNPANEEFGKHPHAEGTA